LRDAVADMKHHDEFDYVIVNQVFDQAVSDLLRIVAGDAEDLAGGRASLAPLLRDLLA
jgi:guanylate kinase